MAHQNADDGFGDEESTGELTDGNALESFADRPVPAEIGDNLRTLFDIDDPPETLGEWTDAVAGFFGDDWPPEVADLCHDDEGRHRVEADGNESETGTEGENYRFVCVLDAVLLPFLTDESVTVYSEGPETGETVTSHVSREGIETDPEAVLSFGAASVESGTELTPQLLYESLCPYVHAFADEEAYERWAERTDAPTMALPLAEGFGLARALVRA